MKFKVTFRKMDPTDAIKQYAEEKVKKIKRFFPDPINAHVVLSLERHLHRADVNIRLHNGLVLKGQEASDDMYSSIDLVMAKIEKQVRRYKDKIRGHKKATGPHIPFRIDVVKDAEARVAYEAEEAAAEARDAEAEEGEEIYSAEDYVNAKSKVIRSENFTATPMSVEEAVMQLNLMNNAFLVFTNAGSQTINVLYRRSDGNYGLIDTA